MISKEDKAKIEDFREVFRMIVNLKNNKDINKVVDDLFKNVEYNYEEYKDEVPYVSVNQEKYKYHILQPNDGKYSLLDFLLNRAISNVGSIWITNDNSYSSEKIVSINNNRYEKEKTNYSEDFIEMQYRKSRLHETGHALHALDEREDNTIHNRKDKDFKKEIQLYNELLGYKYSNLLQISDIKGISQNVYGWHNKHSFVDYTLDEASTEYFATKYSGLYENDKNDGVTYICRTEDKTEGVSIPNRFNGYSHGSCLIYHLENLISKKSIFQSLFFANDEASEEFFMRYSEQIEKVLERYKEEQQSKLPKFSQFKTYGKFRSIFSYACTPQPAGARQEMQEKFTLCYEIMSAIFAYSYLQEYNMGRISKEKMLKILPMAYRLSPVVVDKEKNVWVDTPIRKGYKDFYKMIKEPKKDNKDTSKVTPDSISNRTVKTVHNNPGELSKKVQNVSKSFYDSLKQNGYTQDDDIKTRSGLRYAQIDAYNRKKHGNNR